MNGNHTPQTGPAAGDLEDVVDAEVIDDDVPGEGGDARGRALIPALPRREGRNRRQERELARAATRAKKVDRPTRAAKGQVSVGGVTTRVKRVAVDRGETMGQALITDVGGNWRERRMLKAEAKREAERFEASTTREVVQTVLPTLERKRRKGVWGKNGLWGTISPGVPAHVTSSARIGVLNPFLAPRTLIFDGGILGIETTSKQPFAWHPWAPVTAGLTTSPGVAMWGSMGSGKSMAAKIAMIRSIEHGYQVIIAADPKGEWAKIARRLAGQVVSIGPGSGTVINILDEGVRPTEVDDEEWRQIVLTRRVLALESVCYTLRGGRPHNDVDDAAHEVAAIEELVAAMGAGQVRPTVAGAWEALLEPPPGMFKGLDEKVLNTLALTLRRLVKGSMAGMFDSESTVKLDVNAPMVVIDTSRLKRGGDMVRQIATAATSAWIDAVLRSQDGRYRIVLTEEAWDELRNPAQAQAMDERLRMTGAWKVCNWLIFHELKDITKFGAPDSEHRNTVKGVITMSETKVLFKQTKENMAMIREFVNITSFEESKLTTLKRGTGIWHFGDQATPIAIRAICGPRLYKWINTDDGRYGR